MITKAEIGDDRFPEKFISIGVKLVYYLGDISILQYDVSCVIGRREVSDIDIRMAMAVGKDVAKRGGVLLNGLAIGSDTEAVKGALSVGGRVACVLPCGLDHIYPSSNKQLAKQILDLGGCVLSCYEDTDILKYRFLERNKVQAILSNRVLVTAANDKGGAMYTANYAFEKDIPVGCFGDTPGCRLLTEENKAIHLKNREEYDAFFKNTLELIDEPKPADRSAKC